MKSEQELDGITYEFFVRRVFNCERDDEKYPFADNRAWMALVYREEWAVKEKETTPSKYDKRKEYDKYFIQMVKDLGTTLTYAQVKFHSEEVAQRIKELQSNLAKASSLEELKTIVFTGSGILDELNVVLN